MDRDNPKRVDLLRPAEVAAQLGVSRTWLYDAAKNGRIPSIRIGGRHGPLRFVPEDLRHWIDDARAERVPKPERWKKKAIVAENTSRASKTHSAR